MTRHLVCMGIGVAVMVIATGPIQAKQSNPLTAKAEAAGKDPDKLLALGELYVEAMALKKAKQTFKKVPVMARPELKGEVKFGLARVQIASGNKRTAKRTCRLIEHKGKQPRVSAICQGWYWLSMDRSARAMDEFNRAIVLNDVARAKTGIGESYRRRTEYELAMKAYNEAISAGAGHVAWIGLGLTRESAGDLAGATKALKKAVDVEPASCMAHYHLGRLLNNSPTAIEHLKTALTIRSKWPAAQAALGDAHFEAGDHRAALVAYQTAIKGNPSLGRAHWGLGRVHLKLGDKAAAIEALAKAIAHDQGNIVAFLTLAAIQREMGDFDATLITLEKARKVAGRNIEVYLTSGTIYFELKRYTSARSHLKKAISLNPKLSKAYAMLGDIACERRLYDAGRKYYDNALSGDMVDVDKKTIKSRKAACKPQN